MTQTRYSFTKSPRDDEQLHVEIAALALPGFQGVCSAVGGSTVEVVFADALTAGQETTLGNTVAAHSPAANALLLRLRARAKQMLDEEVDSLYKLTRALALVTMDEVNIVRDWLTDFKAEVAAATSLADLKTRVAALASLPDRTASQLKNAIKAKLDSGDAD
jgi:hypothetical protein